MEDENRPQTIVLYLSWLCRHIVRYLLWRLRNSRDSGELAFIEQTVYFARLLVGLAHNHTSHVWCILLYTAAPQVSHYVLQHRHQIALVLDYLVVVDVALLYLHPTGELVENVGYLLLIDGFNILTHQFEGVAIGNRFVVIIGVYIVAKYAPRLTFGFQ